MSRTPPVRTCVGCRERATKSDLLRVIAVEDGPHRLVLLDESGRGHGRGAHLHPITACLDLAERRRAFSRAFRVEGPFESSALRAAIEARSQPSYDV